MSRIVEHLKSNAVAYAALFIALGGTSYAAIRIPAGSVGNRQLKNHSVSPIKLDRGSIAGYMRDWVQINAQGAIVASRPGAHLVNWQTSGPTAGGVIAWNQPIPAACFALATATTEGATPAYVSAHAGGVGSTGKALTAVLLSAPARAVNVAIMCPQP